MSLKRIGLIEIPASAGSSFDHGAFDPKTRRVFVAHTGRDCIEVIDHDVGKHIATLSGFPGAAGVVADDGIVLVTNRGGASLAWVDGRTLETRGVFETHPRPNGVAIASKQGLAIAASFGEDGQGAKLLVQRLDGSGRYSIDLPGAPRWCVTDAACERVFLAIREPSMILVARAAGAARRGALESVGRRGARARDRSSARAPLHRLRRRYARRDRYRLGEGQQRSGRSPAFLTSPFSIPRPALSMLPSASRDWCSRSIRAPARVRSS